MKQIIIILMLFCISVSVSANITALDFNAGEISNVYNITVCEGPVKIRAIEVTNTNTNIRFNGCVLRDNIHECNCKDSFKVNFVTMDNINAKFAFVIEYLIANEQLRSVRIDNVNIISKDYKEPIIKVSIDPKNALIVGALFAFLLVGIIIKIYNKNLSKSKSKDILNYNFKKDNDKEINDFLKQIK